MIVGTRQARESGRDYALRMIKNNIIHLGLAPGSMVSEQEIASELGISRGPVREALIEMTKVEIVKVYPQRGCRIALVDYALVEEACFMRETLEVAVVERCCQRGLSPEQLAALEENVRLQQFFLDNRSYDKLMELDNGFHIMLFDYTNVTRIHTLMSSMQVHFDRVRAMALTAVKEIRFVEDHRKIFDAVARRDTQLAKELMHAHLTRYQIERESILEKFPQYMK